MTFTEKSGLARIWYRRVKNGQNTLDEVPKLFNLPEVVKAMIDADAS